MERFFLESVKKFFQVGYRVEYYKMSVPGWSIKKKRTLQIEGTLLTKAQKTFIGL
jgi:hypothetical protein